MRTCISTLLIAAIVITMTCTACIASNNNYSEHVTYSDKGQRTFRTDRMNIVWEFNGIMRVESIYVPWSMGVPKIKVDKKGEVEKLEFFPQHYDGEGKWIQYDETGGVIKYFDSRLDIITQYSEGK